MPKWLSGGYTPTQVLYHAIFNELPSQDIAEDDLPKLLEIIDTLGEQKARTIKLRYGIGCDSMTRKETACEMHLSEERVRQVEKQSLHMLRHHSRESQIKPLFLSADEIQVQIKEQDIPQGLQPLCELPTNPKAEESIDALNLSARVAKYLARAEIETVDQLITRYHEGRLLKIRSFGQKALDEVEAKLIEIGRLPDIYKEK